MLFSQSAGDRDVERRERRSGNPELGARPEGGEAAHVVHQTDEHRVLRRGVHPRGDLTILQLPVGDRHDVHTGGVEPRSRAEDVVPAELHGDDLRVLRLHRRHLGLARGEHERILGRVAGIGILGRCGQRLRRLCTVDGDVARGQRDAGLVRHALPREEGEACPLAVGPRCRSRAARRTVPSSPDPGSMEATARDARAGPAAPATSSAATRRTRRPRRRPC